MNQKISFYVAPISWVVAAIVAVILWACKLDWTYYLIGVFTGLLNFGLMVRESRKIARLGELNSDTGPSLAKRQAWLGVLIRMLVFVGVFLAIFFKEVYGGKDGMWNLVIAFGGYATIKVVLIVVYLCFGKKVTA